MHIKADLVLLAFCATAPLAAVWKEVMRLLVSDRKEHRLSSASSCILTSVTCEGGMIYVSSLHPSDHLSPSPYRHSRPLGFLCLRPAG